MRINKDDTASHVAASDNDPVLNQVQMSLGLAGGDVGAYVLLAGNGSGAQGAAMMNQMNQLVGLAMQRPSQGGIRHQSSQGSSAGPAIGAGVGGLALGAVGGALLSQLGKKKNAAAADPIPGGGSAAPGGGAPKVQIQTSAFPATAVASVTTPGNNASGPPTTVQTATQTPPSPPPPQTTPKAGAGGNTWSSQNGVDTSGRAKPQIHSDGTVTKADDLSKNVGNGTTKPALPPLMGFENGKLVYKPPIPGFVTMTPPPKCDPNLASCPDPLASNLFSSTSNGTK